MTDREEYEPGPSHGAQVVKDGETWTLILVRDLRHSPEKVGEAIRHIFVNGRPSTLMGVWVRLEQ